MLHVLNYNFCFPTNQNITNYILRKHLYCIGYSDILNKLVTIVYSLCFKKQAPELLLHLSFKAKLPTN